MVTFEEIIKKQSLAKKFPSGSSSSLPGGGHGHVAAQPISKAKTFLQRARSFAKYFFQGPPGTENVIQLTAPAIGPSGGGVLTKAGGFLKSTYGKLTANPFAGTKTVGGAVKAYLAGAAGLLATEEAVRHLYKLGAGEQASLVPPTSEFTAAAFGGLNRYAALPAFLTGLAKKGGVSFVDLIKGQGINAAEIQSRFPGGLPQIPDWSSLPTLPNYDFSGFSFQQAPISFTSEAPSVAISPGGGMNPELLLGALGLLGAGALGGYVLGRRKKYKKRRKHKKR